MYNSLSALHPNKMVRLHMLSGGYHPLCKLSERNERAGEAFFIVRRKMLTQERLKELLHYDNETGIFIWLINKGRTKKGDAAGTVKNNGYVGIMINRKIYAAHRLAWFYITGEFPKNYIDHKNHIRTDNRFINLREATHKENSQNISAPHGDNRSGYLGVHWVVENKKFRAQISIHGKKKHLGLFDNAQDAHNAYQNAKKILHPFFMGC